MQRVLLLIIFVFMVLDACHFPGRYRLARTNEKVNFHALYKSNSILMPDTNAVYLFGYASPVNEDSIFRFRRYFGNGRVYTSRRFYNTPPTDQDYNKLTTDGPVHLRQGRKHYYDVKEDGLLRHEYFVSGYDGYHFTYSKVYPDSIVNIRRKNRTILASTRNIHSVYVKKEVNLTNFEVDW